jgi:hypothetical protein
MEAERVTLDSYEYLDFPFSVDVAEPRLRARIRELFADCRSNAAPQTAFAITGGERGRFGICVDALCARTSDDLSFALAHLMWEINRRAVAQPSQSLVLHTGAVTRNGIALLCSGRSGAGKSTLVAALVTAGFSYLSDDAVAVDLDNACVRPAPKPIALGRATAELFPTLHADAFGGTEHFVTAAELGGRVGETSPLGVVVLPEYVPGADVRVRSMSRAEALVLLAQQAFNFHLLRERAFRGLASALRSSECLHIEYGDARDAASVLDTLTFAVAPS